MAEPNYSNDSAPGQLPNWTPSTQPSGGKWKGRIQDEPWHAVQARFSVVDFWVQRGSDSEPVRLAPYTAPYRRGARHDVMGQDPRTTPVSALLTKSQVNALRKLRDAGIPKTYRDPTLGSYTALLQDVNANWDAQKLNFYQCELSFVRDGYQGTITSTQAPSSAQSAATAQKDSILAKQAAVGALPDFVAADANPNVATANSAATAKDDAANAAWDDFSSALQAEVDAAPDPAIGKNDLARVYNTLVAAGNEYVDAVDATARAGEGLYLADTQEQLYSLRDDFATLHALAADAVGSVANEVSSWAKILITDQIDLAILIQRELGVVSESIIGQVMEANQPGWIIDPFMLPPGLEISIPVNLNEFV